MQLADRLIEKAHAANGALAARRWRAGRGDRRIATWPEAARGSSLTKSSAVCNICGWRGQSFQGVAHSESALCPTCGSISRDRFRMIADTGEASAHGAPPAPTLADAQAKADERGPGGLTFSDPVALPDSVASTFQLVRTGPTGTTGSVGLAAAASGNTVTLTRLLES